MSERNMSEKFSKVTMEEGDILIFEQVCALGEYEVLYQNWVWEDIEAHGMIFADEDVSHLTDEQIIAEVKLSPMVNKDSEITFARNKDGFTFVNFNFEADYNGRSLSKTMAGIKPE